MDHSTARDIAALRAFAEGGVINAAVALRLAIGRGWLDQISIEPARWRVSAVGVSMLRRCL